MPVFSSVDHEKFRALRITHMATRFEELVRDEANDNATPEELFLTAVDEALETRRSNRIEKLVRQSGFPVPEASVAEISYATGREINPTRMKRYATRDWKANPRNMLIISPTGGGKTYVVCPIRVAACHTEHTVHFVRMDDLARQLVIARGDAIGHQSMFNKFSRVDLLIIDDFLSVGIDPNAASDRFTILANRDHRLPAVIVSQSAPAYWVETLPDRIAADSTVNRLATIHAR